MRQLAQRASAETPEAPRTQQPPRCTRWLRPAPIKTGKIPKVSALVGSQYTAIIERAFEGLGNALMRSAAAVSAASLANRDSSLTDPNRFFACSDARADVIKILHIMMPHPQELLDTNSPARARTRTRTRRDLIAMARSGLHDILGVAVGNGRAAVDELGLVVKVELLAQGL